MKIDETLVLLKKLSFRHFILGLGAYVMLSFLEPLMLSSGINKSNFFNVILAVIALLIGIYNAYLPHAALKFICGELTSNTNWIASVRYTFVV